VDVVLLLSPLKTACTSMVPSGASTVLHVEVDPEIERAVQSPRADHVEPSGEVLNVTVPVYALPPVIVATN
jgi:pentose-5-phosphate-3-epimerase